MVNRPVVYTKVAARGEVGLGESYVDDDWVLRPARHYVFIVSRSGSGPLPAQLPYAHRVLESLEHMFTSVAK